MKEESVRILVRLFLFACSLIGALAGVAFWVFSTPARAEEEQTLHAIECAPTCFMVAGRELAGLVMANKDLAARLKEVEAERDKLKSIKGCAKLEVTEPPKLPPLKRERDS